MSETVLIEQILAGNKKLYSQIVEKYQPMVFRTCIGFVHNKDDADDITQEVFINAYQSLSKFKGNSSVSTWLYRITINASLNFIRNNSKRSIFDRFNNLFGGNENKPGTLHPFDPENPEQLIIKEEHRQTVQKVLDSLPENQRIAIVLSKYDELPQKEIAEIMNTTEGAVEALIQRAKNNLREKLKNSVGKK
jgi:RNA polymerase sigma-70 factor (ECF subfamily)